jgi:hypothetical protein
VFADPQRTLSIRSLHRVGPGKVSAVSATLGGQSSVERRANGMRPVITAEMLDAMTPAERQEAFDASVVRDLTDLPPHLQALVDDARAFVRQRDREDRTAS